MRILKAITYIILLLWAINTLATQMLVAYVAISTTGKSIIDTFISNGMLSKYITTITADQSVAPFIGVISGIFAIFQLIYMLLSLINIRAESSKKFVYLAASLALGFIGFIIAPTFGSIFAKIVS